MPIISKRNWRCTCASASVENSGQLPADGLVKSYVRDDAAAKKSRNAVARAVIELVGDQEIQRLQVLLQRSDGADRNDPLDAELLHGVDIGAIINFRGKKTMSASMAREEGHALPFQSSGDQRVRRIAERRLDSQFARL